MKYDWLKEKVSLAVKDSDSYSEVLSKLNIPISGRNSDTLKRKIKEYNLSVEHFTLKKHYDNLKVNKKDVSEYLLKGTTIKPYKLKLRLLDAGLKLNKCECCGITEWQGKEINCLLHHIDGEETNNELSNLLMLCPNCHSQTDNYCGSANKPELNRCPDCGAIINLKSKYCRKCSYKHRNIK